VDLTCVRTFATNAGRPFPRRSSFTPKVRIPRQFVAAVQVQWLLLALPSCDQTPECKYRCRKLQFNNLLVMTHEKKCSFLVPAYDFLLRNRVNDRPGPGRSGEPTARATATNGREPGGAPEAIFLFSAMLCLSSSSMSIE
jgi:hypothetical protein